ncbi:hypothetical protein H4R34_004836 [Dimargaris verticillata]|uniref:Uncharacterized protein n=1 Tax=Dimargaris verticillata TaxID=2761393 RepID=A0A9W8B4T0_9FUNG|nr:hypothetical protein H4R34_004836 [Dimargaris verticillata]
MGLHIVTLLLLFSEDFVINDLRFGTTIKYFQGLFTLMFVLYTAIVIANLHFTFLTRYHRVFGRWQRWYVPVVTALAGLLAIPYALTFRVRWDPEDLRFDMLDPQRTPRLTLTVWLCLFVWLGLVMVYGIVVVVATSAKLYTCGRRMRRQLRFSIAPNDPLLCPLAMASPAPLTTFQHQQLQTLQAQVDCLRMVRRQLLTAVLPLLAQLVIVVYSSVPGHFAPDSGWHIAGLVCPALQGLLSLMAFMCSPCLIRAWTRYRSQDPPSSPTLSDELEAMAGPKKNRGLRGLTVVVGSYNDASSTPMAQLRPTELQVFASQGPPRSVAPVPPPIATPRPMTRPLSATIGAVCSERTRTPEPPL